MYNWIFIILAVGLASATLPATLFFRNGVFKIAQFTDLHFRYNAEDEHTVDVQTTVIAAEDPDLVVMTGDVVSGNNIEISMEGDDIFRAEYSKAVYAMQEASIPWAFVFGNRA
jgi:predicted MPP superfamily phosphohydrolase